jgi:hypothetical protein
MHSVGVGNLLDAEAEPRRDAADTPYDVNLLEPLLDELVMKTPSWSQPGPTTAPGWSFMCAAGDGKGGVYVGPSFAIEKSSSPSKRPRRFAARPWPMS